MAYYNGLWQFEGFRNAQRRMTLVWGVVYIVEALVRVALSYVLDTSTMVTLSPFLIYGTLGGLALWTVRFVKRTKAEGEKRAAAAAAAPPPGRPPPPPPPRGGIKTHSPPHNNR
ncbi:hypothetical protein ACFVHW_39305, partial [Streptomyces sp. NPDC127110]